MLSAAPPRSQEVFRQAMATTSVRLELLPVANKPRYEKSVIGQLFAADGREPPATTTARSRSPAVARARPADAQEPRPGARQETRLPEARAKTPEPGAQLLSSGPEAPERRSPSPTMPRSPATVAAIPNATGRRGGKRVKIDLRKGRSITKVFFFFLLDVKEAGVVVKTAVTETKTFSRLESVEIETYGIREKDKTKAIYQRKITAK